MIYQQNSGTTVTGCVNKGDVTDAKGSAGGIIGGTAAAGDSTNVVLWITVFVIAAGMLVGGFICMKRRKNK